MSKTVTSFTFNAQETLSCKGLRGLFRLLIGFRKRYLTGVVFLALALVTKTSTYLLLRYFVDNIVGTEAHWSLFAATAGSFVGLALIQGTLTFSSGRLIAKSAEGIIQRLRNFLFHHIQSLSFTYHDKTKTGELIQRTTSDVETLRRFFSEQAIGAGRILMLFMVNFIAIVNLNWKLAFASIIIIPPVVLVSFFFFRKISKSYEAFQEQEAKVMTVLQENLTGVRVVKAFARQFFEREKFDIENLIKYRKGKHLLTLHSVFWPLTDFLCALQLLAGYCIGALMVMNGNLTLGSYLAYAGLIIWIIFPMRNLGRLIVAISMARVSFERISEIISEKPEPLFHGKEVPNTQIKGEFVFKNVSFGYAENVPVLRGISFTCKPGAIIALLGPTGSGKSSLVNLLPRFYEYTGGKIELDGIELKEYHREFLRRNIGIVEQEPFLFSLTIGENITYGCDREVTVKEIEEAAKAAAIHDTIVGFPEGYNTLVGEKGVTLSGGQKQRVAIARALLKNPRILILDDSTSSVDSETEQGIWQALEQLMMNRTTFLIAHRIQSLMKANLIIVLVEGRIVQQGDHQQLMKEDGIYKKIYEMQSRIEVELKRETTHV